MYKINENFYVYIFISIGTLAIITGYLLNIDFLNNLSQDGTLELETLRTIKLFIFITKVMGLVMIGIGLSTLIFNKNKYLSYKFIWILLFGWTSLYFYAYNCRNVSRFTATHWMFSYDQGFIKRGLPGSIMGFFINPIIYRSQINKVSTFLSLFVVVILILLAIVTLYKTKFSDESIFMVMLFMISPFTLRYLFYDNGRYNIINLILVLIIISVVLIKRHNKLYIILGLLLSNVGFFIHESFIFISLPLLISILFLTNPLFWNISKLKKEIREHKKLILLVLLSFVLSFSIILLFGKSNVTISEFIEILRTRTDFNISLGSTKVLYRSVWDNLKFTFNRKSNLRDFVEIPISIITTLCWVYWPLSKLKNQLSNIKDTNFIVYVFLFLPVLTPFILFLVGIDTWRWISYSIINAYLLYIILIPFLDIPGKKLTFQLKTLLGKVAISGCFISFLIMGPSIVRINWSFFVDVTRRLFGV